MIMNIQNIKTVLEELKKLEEVFAYSDKLGSYPESLLSSNEILLYLRNEENYKLFFLVTGEVDIASINEDGVRYKGDQRFDDEKLMKEIKEGIIYTSASSFVVDMNNWFEVYVYNENDDIVYDYVYENCPSNPVDLILDLIKVLEDTTNEYEGC